MYIEHSISIPDTHTRIHWVFVLVSLSFFFIFLHLVYALFSRKPHMLHSTQLPGTQHTQTTSTMDDVAADRRRANQVKWDHLSIQRNFFLSSLQFFSSNENGFDQKSVKMFANSRTIIFVAKAWIKKQIDRYGGTARMME